MLSEKCFVMFYVFSFPSGVYVGTLNLIALIPGPFILTLSKVCSLLLNQYVHFQAEQVKIAAVISAEGESKAAELLAKAFGESGEGLVELRKLEAAEDVAHQLARSRNVVYLPTGQQTLLSLPS